MASDSQAGRLRVENGGVTPLSDDRVAELLAELPEWQRVDDEIVKTYQLRTFPAAIRFVTLIADRAELADHHPDIDIRYHRVRVALSTHDAGGITDKDFALAREIETIAAGSDDS